MRLNLRQPIEEDAIAISECLRGSSEPSQMTDGSPDSSKAWNDLSGSAAIAERIASGEVSLVACMDEQIVGYIAFRRTNHLSLLFVRKGYQGQGIGRSLVDKTIRQFSEVTVNSTDVAVKFYERMGFKVSGERFLKRGAWSTPMKWIHPAAAANMLGTTDS